MNPCRSEQFIKIRDSGIKSVPYKISIRPQRCSSAIRLGVTIHLSVSSDAVNISPRLLYGKEWFV